MKGVIKIGKVTKDQILNVYKKASREIELENSNGWVANIRLKNMKEKLSIAGKSKKKETNN